MQNKPNLLNAQMNVNKVLTKDYENVRLHRGFKKQTQSNPIFNPKNAPRLCNVFPFDRADITITGPIKYEKERAGNADWIRTDKFTCGRFGR